MPRRQRYWSAAALSDYGFPPVARYRDIACRPDDNNFFFPDRNAANATKRAKSICASCNHRSECATWALRVREPEGVWGGLDPDEREAILRTLDPAAAKNHTTPGRPRKVKG